MGKGWIVVILLLVCRLDSWALSSVDKKQAQLKSLINRYNSINTFDKNLYAKRVQILKNISKIAKHLYEKTNDINFAKIHETYSTEAQDLIKRFYSQRDSAAAEAKFSGRSRRSLKPWRSTSQRMKIASLTPFGQTLSHNRENFAHLPELVNKADMADKALANLHRMTPDHNFQDFRGSSLALSPSARDMDAPYVPQAPKRLAHTPQRADVD